MTPTPLDQLFHGYNGAVPGASALLLQDGVALVEAAYGLADLERNIPATSATNYRLASVTSRLRP